MRLALFEPEIAGNVGAVMRLGACFGVAVDLIEPCGFPFSDRKLKRAGMDYAAEADVSRHADWPAFTAARTGRLILLSSHGDTRLPDMRFAAGDVLLFGSEGAGVPDAVHAAADARVRIPMAPGFRSLNVAVSAGIALAEALRKTGGFPA